MGTPEHAVLQGVYNGVKIRDEDHSAGDGGRILWLNNMGEGLMDIERGLRTRYGDLDRALWRLNIASMLFSKVLDNDQSFVATSPSLHGNFEQYRDCIPPLDWLEFFHSIAFLGLGPEFAELLLEMEPKVQEEIFDRLSKWLFQRKELKITGDCNDTAICLSLLISIYIAVKFFKFHGNDVGFVLGQVTKLLKSFLEITKEHCFQQEALDVKGKCQLSMIRKLQTLVFDLNKSSQKNRVEMPNAFYCSNFPFVLSGSIIQSIIGNQAEQNAQDLLDKLTTIKKYHPEDSKDSKVMESETQLFDDCMELARDCLRFVRKRISNGKGTERNFGVVFEGLLSLLDDLSKDGAFQEILAPEASVEDEKRLNVISHRLQGFEHATETLLAEIAEDPAKNISWKKPFACLQSNPECIATKSQMLLILYAVQACNSLSEKKNQDVVEKYIYVATSFQQLFWSGFHLLRLVDKLEVTEKVMSKYDLSSLLCEYPLKEFESDSQRVGIFEQRHKKNIKLYFDALMTEVLANDSVAEKFCEVLLISPEVTIQRFVEQALRSEQQAKLMKDLSLRFKCLLGFKIKGSKISLFWDSLNKLLLSLWKRKEISSVESGLYFIHHLLGAEWFPGSAPIDNLIEEMLGTLAVSLSEGRSSISEESGLPEKLALKLLSCVADVPLFFERISLEKIVALCFTLAGRIESSICFWDSDKNFDEDVQELLVKNLEFLVSHSTEKLKSSTEMHNDLLKWISKIIPSFNWTVQIRFLPFILEIDDFELPVPACLSEVCTLPDIFQSSQKLSYGIGTGLLAWHQCFIVNTSLCPLSSLSLGTFSLEEIELFSNGWIVTLSQILPYCLPNQWCTLFEASKVLISDFKLHVPFYAKHVITLPAIDMNETHAVLGVVQLMRQIFGLLSEPCCSSWTSQQIWSHLSKCYCVIVSSLISDSAEFYRASQDAQIFMLAQIFCSVCDMISLFYHLPYEKLCSESLFILSLDVISSFEKILSKIKVEELAEDEYSDVSGGDDSNESSSFKIAERGYEKSVLEIFDRLQEMLRAVSCVPNENNQRTLNQKLLNLMKVVKE